MSSESATGLGDIDQKDCSSVMNGQANQKAIRQIVTLSRECVRNQHLSAYRKRLPDDEREALQQDKAFIDMLFYRKQRLCHYAAADKVVFFLSVRFSIPGIDTLSAKSLAALRAY